MALGTHLHATWDILSFVPNGTGPKSKHALIIPTNGENFLCYQHNEYQVLFAHGFLTIRTCDNVQFKPSLPQQPIFGQGMNLSC